MEKTTSEMSHPQNNTLLQAATSNAETKACKRASAFPAHVTAFQDGFRIAHAQKNKINLCFVDRLVQVDNDKKIKAK